MKNPIPHHALFTTPSSLEQLLHMGEQMGNSAMVMFTLNYCHQLVEETIKDAQRIRVVSKDRQVPWVHDPEAEEDRIAYEREQLMRP